MKDVYARTRAREFRGLKTPHHLGLHLSIGRQMMISQFHAPAVHPWAKILWCCSEWGAEEEVPGVFLEPKTALDGVLHIL